MRIISRKSQKMSILKFPVTLFEHPVHLSVAFVNCYWVTTDKAEILVQKWYETDLSINYQPQVSQDEQIISQIAIDHNLSPKSYCKIDVLYLPNYMLHQTL